jgi:hypothetical protein
MNPGATINRHQQLQTESQGPILRPKVCACGKTMTARQLKQHGKCVTCVLVATLAPGDVEKLQHMLGATEHFVRSKWGWRNHYCCGVQDRAAMHRLVDAGLAREGNALLSSVYFHATPAGCQAVGIGAAGTRLAMEAQP